MRTEEPAVGGTRAGVLDIAVRPGHTRARAHRHTGTQARRYAGTQVRRYAGTEGEKTRPSVAPVAPVAPASQYYKQG